MLVGVAHAPAVGRRLHAAVSVVVDPSAPGREPECRDFLIDPDEQLLDPVLGVGWRCVDPELGLAARGKSELQARRMAVSLSEFYVEASGRDSDVAYAVVEGASVRPGGSALAGGP